MKKVTLNFIGTGIKNECQACVYIYDTCGNLLYELKTYDGTVTVYLMENEVYRVVATSCSDIINTFFYVNKCKYTFIFSRALLNIRTITFLLTDANYKNLPIEKGMIILWQK